LAERRRPGLLFSDIVSKDLASVCGGERSSRKGFKDEPIKRGENYTDGLKKRSWEREDELNFFRESESKPGKKDKAPF